MKLKDGAENLSECKHDARSRISFLLLLVTLCTVFIVI